MSKSSSAWSVRDLEARVLDGSGLGSLPGWGNGPGAENIRYQAAKRAAKTIQYLHSVGAKIAPPEPRLLRYIEAAAEYLDREEWDLSRTWQVTSDVARAHIDMGHAETDEQRKRAFDACVANMDAYYGLTEADTVMPVMADVAWVGGDATWLPRSRRTATHGIVQRVKTPPGGGPMPALHELLGLALMRKRTGEDE